MGETVVIELGDRRSAVEPPAARPWPPRQRRALLLALAAVLAATLGGARPWPAPQTPTLIPAAQGDLHFFDDDRYYVLGPDPGAPRPRTRNRTVSVYRLPDARLLTRVEVAVPGMVNQIRAVGGTLVLAYQSTLDGAETTVGVDDRTGRQRWRQTAGLAGWSPSGRLLVLYEPGDGVRGERWLGVEPGSGRVAWTVAAGDGGALHPDWDPGGVRRLLSTEASGRVSVRDLDTGRVLVAADLPVPDRRPDRGPGYWTVGDLLLIERDAGLTAYGLDRLDRRWHSPVNLSRTFPAPFCGALVCLFDRGGGGTRALDPVTGRLRWHAPDWGVWGAADGSLLASAELRSVEHSPLAVLDPATGGLRGDVGLWQPAGRPGPDGRTVVMRVQLSTAQVWFAVLHPAALTVELLGVATDVTGDCRATADAFVCRRLDATVGVWPLP